MICSSILAFAHSFLHPGGSAQSRKTPDGFVPVPGYGNESGGAGEEDAGWSN